MQLDDPSSISAGQITLDSKRRMKWCVRAINLCALAIAFYVVDHQFRVLDLVGVIQAVRNIPVHGLFLAGCFTLLSYFLLSFYDQLAAKQLGYKLPFRRCLIASFCAYVLSHNLGFSALSGAAVRFRFYGNWGLKPRVIVQMIAFCSTTFLLGCSAILGGVFLFSPTILSNFGIHFSSLLVYGVGVTAWVVVAGYILIAFTFSHMSLRGYRFALPSAVMAIAQVIVATTEVTATAAIFYALISHSGLSFFVFLAIYIASYCVGLLTAVPGGMGVFDGAMLLGLAGFMSSSEILGAMLVFRLFYYIVPFFLAGVILARHEIVNRAKKLRRKKR